MNNKLATTQKAFIESFIQECFSQGLNEKQADTLLTIYRETESLQCDTDFRRGFEEEAVKQAFMKGLKSIGQSIGSTAKKNPLISSSLGLGAGAGAIAAPGLLPNDSSSGAAAGAIGGGLLGMLPGLAKGLKWRGGVGRTAGGALLKGLFSGGTVRGAIGGAAAGGAAGLTQAFKNRPIKMSPDTGVPLSFQQGNAEGSSGANPFGLPPDLLREVNNHSTGATNGAGKVGPPDLSLKKNELVSLEGQINALESQLPDGSNPNSYAQRNAMQPQLDVLKMKRRSLAAEVQALEAETAAARPRINTLAHQRLSTASRGLNRTQEEFGNLKGRLDYGTNGGMVGGTLMDWYNNLTGAKDRMQVLQPQYDAYNKEIQNAQKLQEMSN